MQKIKMRKVRAVRSKKKIAVANQKNKPKVTLFKSGRHFYVQLVDDNKGITIASASTLQDSKELKLDLKKNCNSQKNVELLAEIFAKRCLDKKIKTIVFDKSGYMYHGKVKCFAESLRKAGLTF